MANYIASAYTSSKTTLALAAADIETKLETLDSTTQAAWLVKVLQDRKGNYITCILHKDTS
jgi:hypothetical protein